MRSLAAGRSGSSRALWRFSRKSQKQFRVLPCAGQGGVATAFLDRVARAAGIRSNWHDIYGKEHIVPDATKQALLADMGYAAGSNAEARESLSRLADWENRRQLPATLSAYEGEFIGLRIARSDGGIPAALLMEREDGGSEPIRLDPGSLEFGSVTALDGCRVETVLARLPALPAGRYRLFAERAPDLACHLTVAPRQCFLPELPAGTRLSGIAAQLYALRRSGDQGVGDFTALGDFAEMAAKAGAATVGLNPLHVLFSQDRERASPYYPSDRRFLDPIYIDVTALDGPSARAALASCLDQTARLSALPDVDYPGVWALKRAILEASFADFERSAQAHPAAISRTSWTAAVQAWHSLPASRQSAISVKARNGLAGPPHCATGTLAHWPPSRGRMRALVRFHLYLQWLADGQFRSGGMRRGRGPMARLLPRLGRRRGSRWRGNLGQRRSVPGLGTSVGAPPDPFAEGGQNWGLKAP